jgi:hypothetical protein
VRRESSDKARQSLEADGVTGYEVQPYARLRENLVQRDRSLCKKVISMLEAASFVQESMTVGVGGSTMSRTPMAMLWELIRQNRRASRMRGRVGS